MKFIAVLALGASLATAAPVDTTTPSSVRSTECSADAISQCAAATGLDNTTCFAQLCTTLTPPELRRRADNPKCTEQNLLDCAVTQWRNPDICFQEFCLDS